MARFSRYGNISRQTSADGTVLDSKRERTRYEQLLLLQRAHEISNLAVHPRYILMSVRGPILMRSERYPKGRKLTYVADFRYRIVETGEFIIEDVKMQSGHRTGIYKIKRALMESMGHKILET